MNKLLSRYGAWIVAVVSACWMGRFFDRGINVLDEGFVAALSLRVLQGEVPYTDFFTLLMPGVFLLHAGLYGLFGPSLWIGRWVLLLIGIAIPVLVYLIGRHRLAPLPCLVAAMLNLLWGPTAWEYLNHANYNWLAHLWGLVALWGCCRLIALDTLEAGQVEKKTSRRSHWLGIGLALGLSILFKQTIGAYAFFAIAIFSFAYERGRARFQAWSCLGLGTCLIHVPVLMWLGLKGALPAMLAHILHIPLTEFAQTAAVPYPSLWPIWPQFPSLDHQVGTQFLGLIPLAYPVVSLWCLFEWWCSKPTAQSATRRTHQRTFEALIVLYSVFMFLGNFPRSDFGHLLYNMATGYLVFILLIEHLFKATMHALGRSSAVLGLCCLVLLLARPALEYPLRLTLWTLNTRNTPLDNPRAGVTLSVQEAATLNEVLATLTQIKSRGEEVFVLPHAPMLFFLGDLRNPTRYDVLMQGNYAPGTMQEVMSILNQRQVPWVVLRHKPVDNQTLQDYAPEFVAFLQSNYESTGRSGDYEFFRRQRRFNVDVSTPTTP
ncbi:MAG: hypothetical protein RIS44_1567 [Pseudomonadota bacterium]|jgi:4-amino-4-deoxy-L-arabinose transferase-like glycosyltransferase